MATYRCNDCGTEILSGDNLSGGPARMLCPYRRCPSRLMKPPKKQTIVFGQQQAAGVGQKAMRGAALREVRRGR